MRFRSSRRATKDSCLGRRTGGTDEGRHFTEWPALDDVQDEGGALLRGQSTEMATDALDVAALVDDSFRWSSVIGPIGTRYELEPPALRAAEVFERGADRDPGEPGPYGGLPAESGKRANGDDERLLQQVVHVGLRADQATQSAFEEGCFDPKDGLEHATIPAPARSDGSFVPVRGGGPL